LQAWRTNADVQLLIYRSNLNIPDVGEIYAAAPRDDKQKSQSVNAES